MNIVKVQLKPATAHQCTYVSCKEPAVGELRAHNLFEHGPWPLCEKHIKPGMHPPDLRKKLFRWTVIRQGGA